MNRNLNTDDTLRDAANAILAERMYGKLINTLNMDVGVTLNTEDTASSFTEIINRKIQDRVYAQILEAVSQPSFEWSKATVMSAPGKSTFTDNMTLTTELTDQSPELDEFLKMFKVHTEVV